MSELQEIYEDRVYLIDSDYILNFNKYAQQVQINNVITGLEERFYCLAVIDDKEILKYNLIYGDYKIELKGFLLELDTTFQEKERDALTLMFSNSIVENNNQLNVIDVFNTFQRSIRSIFENYNYLTYNPQQFKNTTDPNPLIIAKGVRDIIPVSEIDKTDFYKSFFDFPKDRIYNDGEEHVYLMYNSRNDLVKIGQSKHPNFREKTLQSEEPEIVRLAMWQAPKSVEKELHKLFDSKRKRGEWFDLTFNDLKRIKKQMDNYF